MIIYFEKIGEGNNIPYEFSNVKFYKDKDEYFRLNKSNVLKNFDIYNYLWKDIGDRTIYVFDNEAPYREWDSYVVKKFLESKEFAKELSKFKREEKLKRILND